MKTGKYKLLKKEINRNGLRNGIKIFAYICMQKRWGRKVYSIKHKKLGVKPFYLRSCSSDDYVTGSILPSGGGYDFLYKMEDYISNCKVVLDGGANIGIFSRMILNINPNAEIIAVELENSNCEMIEKNVDGYNVNVVHAGLWNKNEGLVIQDYEMGNEAGFAIDIRDAGKTKSDVSGCTVDQIMNKYSINYIDIIKFDIEGAEIEVFDESAEKWIDKVGVVIVELHDRYRMGCSASVFERMQRHGYQCRNYGENVIFFKDAESVGKMY